MAVVLAERFEELGMECRRTVTRESDVADVAWVCRDEPAPTAVRTVTFGEVDGQATRVGMSILRADGEPFDRPIAVGEFDWLLVHVLGGPELDEVHAWLDATWAMSDAWTRIGGQTFVKSYSGLGEF
ncbi:MAG: hypothetical protein ABIO99_02915 [Candidatus Limnocylindria bacterium]